MPNPIRVARLFGEVDRNDELAQLRPVLAAAIDLVMAHKRGYFGDALKILDQDNGYIASLVGAVEAVDSSVRAEAAYAALLGRQS